MVNDNTARPINIAHAARDTLHTYVQAQIKAIVKFNFAAVKKANKKHKPDFLLIYQQC